MLYLFPAVGRQVEHEHGEERDSHAWNDEVDGVEQRLPPHGDVERDVQVGLVAASVVLHVADRRHLQDVPLDGHVELGEVDADLHLGTADLLVDVAEVNLKNGKG